MVDTQRLAPTSLLAISIAEVAAHLAAHHVAQRVHVLDVATFFPLDVETIARVLEGLQAHYALTVVEGDDGLSYYQFSEVDELLADATVDYEAGEHLEEGSALMRNLASLMRQEAEDFRRAREHHALLACAVRFADSEVTHEVLTRRIELSNARTKSMLNDFVAQGYIGCELDEDSDGLRYRLPPFSYPEARAQRIARALEDVVGHQDESRSRMWIGAVAATTLLVAALIARAIGLW